MKQYIIVAAAVLAAFSCSRVTLDPDNGEIEKVTPKTVRLTITAGNPSDPGTRTEMKTTAGTITPLWSCGDALAVTTLTLDPESEDFDIFKLSSSLNAAQSEATFTGEDVDYYSDRYYYAYYPCPDNVGDSVVDGGEAAVMTRGRYDDEYERMEDWMTYLADDWRYQGVSNFGIGYNYSTGGYDASYDGAAVYVGHFQHPTSDSFDGASDVLASAPFQLDEPGEGEEVTIPDLQFARMVAVVKLILKPGETAFAGQHPKWVSFQYDGGEDHQTPVMSGPAVLEFPVVDPDNPEAETLPAIHPADEDDCYPWVVANLDMYGGDGYSISENNAIYLLVYPQVMKQGGTLFVDVIGSENYHTISRVITLPRDVALDPGTITTFPVSLANADAEFINSPAEINLDTEEVVLDQYDVLTLNANVIGVDEDNEEIDAEYDDFKCKLINNDTGAVTEIDGACYFYGNPMEVTLTASEPGDFTLIVTYGEEGNEISSTTCSISVWPEAELPERLKTWSGTSFSGASYYAKTWFKDFRNSEGNLKTYKASLAQYGEGEGNVPDYAFAGAFENTGGSFDAFQYFTGLTKVPDYAFTYCKKLTGITLPNTISTIGEAAFSSCYDLTRVALLENTIITAINSYAFSGCTSLASLSLPEGLLTIDDGAFNGAGLTSISIPGSVTSIGSSVFSYCSSLSEVTFGERFSLTEIPDGMFSYTDALRSITIPASVASIGENAFFANPSHDGNTFGLQSVTFLGNVTTIGYMAFCFCPLTEINLPASVTTIGDYAFSNTSLSSIVIPAQVSFIGEYAFNNVTFRSGTDGEGVTYQGVKFMGSTPPTFKNSYSKIEGKHWDTLANNNQGGWANGVNIYVPTGKKDDYVSVSNINPDINTELRNSLFVEY